MSFNTNRAARVNQMKRVPSPPEKKETRSWLGFLRGNNLPLNRGITFSNKIGPKLKIGGKGKKLTEYELRALRELSYRSPKVVTMNLKVLKSKKNRRNLRQALEQSKSKTRRRR